jgi:hypothetical protein
MTARGPEVIRKFALEVRGRGSLKLPYGASCPMPGLVRGTDWEPNSQGILVPGVDIGTAPETMGSPFRVANRVNCLAAGNTHPGDSA